MPPQGKVFGLMFAINIGRVDLHVRNCAFCELVPKCLITELVTNYIYRITECVFVFVLLNGEFLCVL
ncbi:hypothetical protein ACTXT7_008330 [Hymenolepis weldensis]